LGQNIEAYQYAKRHLEISNETNDQIGKTTAQLNISELCRILGYTPPDSNILPHEINPKHGEKSEKKEIIQKSEDQEASLTKSSSTEQKINTKFGKFKKSNFLDEEELFEFITRFQSKRMDDQRCSLLKSSKKGNSGKGDISVTKSTKIRLSKKKQQKKQPTVPSNTPDQPQPSVKTISSKILLGINDSKKLENSENSNSIENSENDEVPDDSFFELIVKCQGTRIDEQRTFLPNFDLGSPQSELHLEENSQMAESILEAPTVPDEDFFNLIQKLQSSRLEDQRASLKQ